MHLYTKMEYSFKIVSINNLRIPIPKEKNSDLIFSIKDHGIGIAKRNFKNVFKRYFRVENQRRQFPGMGIDLFISHEIIKKGHGKMWVESKPGEGSTFYFSIPINSH